MQSGASLTFNLMKSFLILLFRGVDEMGKLRESKQEQPDGEHLDTDIVSDSDEEGIKTIQGQEEDLDFTIENINVFRSTVQQALVESQGMNIQIDLFLVFRHLC
jgi:hypothetical protein